VYYVNSAGSGKNKSLGSASLAAHRCHSAVILLLLLVSDFERTSVRADSIQLPSCRVSKICETYTNTSTDGRTDGQAGR